MAPFDCLSKVFHLFDELGLVSKVNVPVVIPRKQFDPSFYNPSFRDFVVSINGSDTLLYNYSKVYFYKMNGLI